VLDRYSHKITSAADLCAKFDRKFFKVIMCHGTFDIVHPGHIRHLLYAKSKADILVASVTSDRFVSKGTHRPHVPQDLRAMNLAALECVDYVIIDDHAEPLEAIAAIRPDYFAKGFEYAANAIAATEREVAALRQYGGEIIFTPGDVVYSSTALLQAAPPSLRLAKLETVMSRAGLTFDRLRARLDSLNRLKVHVVGDTIVDVLVRCALLAGQPKTPTVGALFEREDKFVGGAGVVARHARAAGAKVTLTTLLGGDANAVFVCEELERAGIMVEPCGGRLRPTTEKRVFLVDGYRTLKLDTVDNRPLGADEAEQVAENIRSERTHAIIFSDFRHGLFNERTIPLLAAAIPMGAFHAADSQVASRWGNILDFQGFDLITPNEREARFALGDQDSGVRPLASRLYDKAACGALIMKMGERGVLMCKSADHESLDSFVVLDSIVETAVDPVGAGDALLAYATMALASGHNVTEATILGNLAAGVKCSKEGNVPVSAEDVHGAIDSLEEACK
jgi:rfaE bifunctional protein kinase chain/domain/rfaE bifunctional protein nucleotidyltransferase chain/domain